MNKNIKKIDAELCFLMHLMWIFLIGISLCVLYITYSLRVDPASAIGTYRMIPEMIEHLLGGCVVTVALGVAFEFLAGRS